MYKRSRFCVLISSLVLSSGLTPSNAGETQLRTSITKDGGPAPVQAPPATYPKPQTIAPQQNTTKSSSGSIKTEQKRLTSQTKQTAPPRPANAAPGVLPVEFLGVWQVRGNRSGVEAQPQFQQGINNIFQQTSSDTWTIQGNPSQGFSLTSSTGVTTRIFVDKVQGTKASIHYQHPIKNTVAKEAVTIQLCSGGASFQGRETIEITKQGEPRPRCKVYYQLSGRRR